MIYVSTSCVKSNDIKQSIDCLVKNGFKNIELSGGSEYYNGLEKDLISIKKKKKVNFLLHNYFPPSNIPFVLNLASLNDKIYQMSLSHYKKALDLSKLLGCTKYGLHAGFLMDPDIKDLGKKISKNELFNRSECVDRFCGAYKILEKYSPGIKLYVENNVFSYSNKIAFEKNPFLFTDFETYNELSNKIDFNILLDVAHLKVSSNSLSLSFADQLKKLSAKSDYIHISDNDGLSDLNKSIIKDSDMFNILSTINFENKIVTLEIYEKLSLILKSYDLLDNFFFNSSKNISDEK